MKIFMDTANVEEIREFADMGIVYGVTTNPSLIAKEGRDYMQTLAEITSIVDGPISGEVKASTTTAINIIFFIMGAKILQFVQITKRKRVFLHAETNAEFKDSLEGFICQINSEF